MGSNFVEQLVVIERFDNVIVGKSLIAMHTVGGFLCPRSK